VTATTPIQPIVYGHDASGRPAAIDPAAIDPAGTSPHVLIAGGAGRGLTTLAGVIAVRAARNCSTVRACHPRAQDDTWTRDVPGITAGRGLEETVQLITETRDDMHRRLAAVSAAVCDGADPPAHPHTLLAVDDYSYLALDPRACDAIVVELAEIAAFGRAARMTLLVAAHVLYGFPSWLLDLFGTRIVLGPASAATALRLLGDEGACGGVPDAPGSGTVVTGGALPVAVRVLPSPGGQQ
jgi:hypothetical protein